MGAVKYTEVRPALRKFCNFLDPPKLFRKNQKNAYLTKIRTHDLVGAGPTAYQIVCRTPSMWFWGAKVIAPQNPYIIEAEVGISAVNRGAELRCI